MKKYLISGIPPSHGGVGYLMYSLEKLAKTNQYAILYQERVSESIRQKILNPLLVIKEIYLRIISKIRFIYSLKIIRNSEVILIHPQTIGYKYFIDLVRNNKIVKIYMMDNSFFCIKSYNFLDNKECLKCVGALDNCDARCIPFPVNINKNKNIQFLKKYKNYSSKIYFYAQNNSQAELIKLHFGINTKVEIIGMKTDEDFKEIAHDSDDLSKYDIVFHGANHEAKGINYVFNLATMLPEYTFFIPTELIDHNLPKNIVCKNITWNSGLKEIVSNARLVLNPSLWSAPVEGALLKSIYFNGNVGIVNTQYGFGNDIPQNAVLKLSDDINIAKIQIHDFLKEHITLEKDSILWLNKYLTEECSVEKLFEEVII